MNNFVNDFDYHSLPQRLKKVMWLSHIFTVSDLVIASCRCVSVLCIRNFSSGHFSFRFRQVRLRRNLFFLTLTLRSAFMKRTKLKFTTLDTKSMTSIFEPKNSVIVTSLWKNRISKNLENRTTWNDFSWSDGELVFSDIIIEQLGYMFF